MRISKYSAVLIAAMMAAVSAQAINWIGGTGDWSATTNWNGGVIPNTTADIAGFTSGGNSINVDGSYTVKTIQSLWGANGMNTVSGPGTVTIDRGATNGDGIINAAGNAGGTLMLTGNVVINNAANTYIKNANSSANHTELGTNSTLTLTTMLQTAGGSLGTVAFNGTLASSSANLIIASSNVSFGDGHNSSAFGRDIVFYNNTKLTVDGGTVLAANRKFQFNGNAELELNGANAINGANISVAVANNLLLDVNSNQENMGSLGFGTGVMTIDVDAAVSDLFFEDSSGRGWGGTVAINGFQEGIIKFGTDASGLTTEQLGAITDNTYGLTDTGYLTVVPEPATIGLFAISALVFVVKRRMMRR